MIDLYTLLFASVTARLSFVLIFLIASIRGEASVAFRYWSVSVLASSAGLLLVYSDPHYPYFLPMRGGLIYLIIGTSVVLVTAGGRALLGQGINKAALAITGSMPGLAYGAGRFLGIRPDAVILMTLILLTFLMVMGARTFLVKSWHKHLPSQLAVSIALLVYALLMSITVIMIVIRLVVPDGVPDPFATAIYVALMLDQFMSVLVYVGLIAISLEDSQVRMSEIATTDALTGIANRRGLQEQIAAMIGASRRAKRPMAVLMTDLDHFKLINDQFGHDGGDLVLKEFAHRLTSSCKRHQDVVGRWGGEEFVIILNDMELPQATAFAQSLCQFVSRSAFDLGDRKVVVTVSIGVAAFDRDTYLLENAMKAADEALYEAKRNGRNRVCAAASSA